jgi:hypothetical protein
MCDFEEGRVVYGSFWEDFWFYVHNWHTVISLWRSHPKVPFPFLHGSATSPYAFIDSVITMCSYLYLSLLITDSQNTLTVAVKTTILLASLSFAFAVNAYIALALDCELCAAQTTCQQCTGRQHNLILSIYCLIHPCLRVAFSSRSYQVQYY